MHDRFLSIDDYDVIIALWTKSEGVRAVVMDMWNTVFSEVAMEK